MLYRRSIGAGTAMGVAPSLLASKTPLLGGLREGHVRPIDAQNAAAIYRAFEAAQRSVNVFVVANLNADCHDRRMLVWFRSLWNSARERRVAVRAASLQSDNIGILQILNKVVP
jgi:hypothetical protein